MTKNTSSHKEHLIDNLGEWEEDGAIEYTFDKSKVKRYLFLMLVIFILIALPSFLQSERTMIIMLSVHAFIWIFLVIPLLYFFVKALQSDYAVRLDKDNILLPPVLGNWKIPIEDLEKTTVVFQGPKYDNLCFEFKNDEQQYKQAKGWKKINAWTSKKALKHYVYIPAYIVNNDVHDMLDKIEILAENKDLDLKVSYLQMYAPKKQ